MTDTPAGISCSRWSGVSGRRPTAKRHVVTGPIEPVDERRTTPKAPGTGGLEDLEDPHVAALANLDRTVRFPGGRSPGTASRSCNVA